MEISKDKAIEQSYAGLHVDSVPELSFVEALIDPGNAFHRPSEVVEHPWFTDEEKRTILLSWVRDELVVEQVAVRHMNDLGVHSRIDAVVEALSRIDSTAAETYAAAARAIREDGGLKRAQALLRAH